MNAPKRSTLTRKAQTDPSKLVADLAQKHGIGTVGLAGKHATGEAGEFSPVEVFVTVPFEAAEDFGDELAEQTGRTVHLYAPAALPSSHALHYAVRWMNVVQLPRVPVRRGAVLRVLEGKPVCIPLAQIAHFEEADNPPPPTGRPMRSFSIPIGGFLLCAL